MSGILWPVEDGQGNVRDILGSAGTILDHRVLDTFGNILSQSGSSIDFDHFQSGMFWGGEKGVRNRLLTGGGIRLSFRHGKTKTISTGWLGVSCAELRKRPDADFYEG